MRGAAGGGQLAWPEAMKETVFSLATDVSVGGTESVGEIMRGAEGGGQQAWPEVKEEAVCSLAMDVSVGAREGGSAALLLTSCPMSLSRCCITPDQLHYS